jgi:hypothetical protein
LPAFCPKRPSSRATHFPVTPPLEVTQTCPSPVAAYTIDPSDGAMVKAVMNLSLSLFPGDKTGLVTHAGCLLVASAVSNTTVVPRSRRDGFVASSANDFWVAAASG